MLPCREEDCWKLLSEIEIFIQMDSYTISRYLYSHTLLVLCRKGYLARKTYD